jgi:hypothetical protein
MNDKAIRANFWLQVAVGNAFVMNILQKAKTVKYTGRQCC